MNFKRFIAVLSAVVLISSLVPLPTHRTQASPSDDGQNSQTETAPAPLIAPELPKVNEVAPVAEPNRDKTVTDVTTETPATPELLPNCALGLAYGDWCRTTAEENGAWSGLKAQVKSFSNSTSYQIEVSQSDNPQVDIVPDQILLTFPVGQ